MKEKPIKLTLTDNPPEVVLVNKFGEPLLYGKKERFAQPVKISGTINNKMTEQKINVQTPNAEESKKTPEASMISPVAPIINADAKSENLTENAGSSKQPEPQKTEAKEEAAEIKTENSSKRPARGVLEPTITPEEKKKVSKTDSMKPEDTFEILEAVNKAREEGKYNVKKTENEVKESNIGQNAIKNKEEKSNAKNDGIIHVIRGDQKPRGKVMETGDLGMILPYTETINIWKTASRIGKPVVDAKYNGDLLERMYQEGLLSDPDRDAREKAKAKPNTTIPIIPSERPAETEKTVPEEKSATPDNQPAKKRQPVKRDELPEDPIPAEDSQAAEEESEPKNDEKNPAKAEKLKPAKPETVKPKVDEQKAKQDQEELLKKIKAEFDVRVAAIKIDYEAKLAAANKNATDEKAERINAEKGVGKLRRAKNWWKGLFIGAAVIAAGIGTWFGVDEIMENKNQVPPTPPQPISTPKPSEAAGTSQLEVDMSSFPNMKVLQGQEYEITGPATIVGDVNAIDSKSETGQIEVIKDGETVKGIADNSGSIIYGYDLRYQSGIVDFQTRLMKKLGGNGPSDPPKVVYIIDSGKNIIETR
jgi:hypothetical protein